MNNINPLTNILTDLGHGGMTKIADGCGVSLQAVSRWFQKGKIPVERVPDVERVLAENGSEITRYDIAPRIFGMKPELNPKPCTAENAVS